MSGTNFEHIPFIDVGILYGTDDEAKHKLADECRTILRDIGFAYIINHQVPAVLVDGLREQSRQFFDMPVADKNAIAINQWHRGYMAPNTSTIVTSSVAKVTKPNQSESFLILHDLEAGDPDVVAGKPLQGPNQWPENLPALQGTALEYVAAMTDLAGHISQLMALCLGMPAAFFKPYFEHPTTFLRLLHYPPQPVEEGLFGSAPHTDYGFITLLAQDDVGGLEVKNKSGEWIAAPPVPGSFVMNVGDILSRWSGGIFASTPHRVINTTGRERYSQPFFYDPSMDAVISPVAGEGTRFVPVRYGDYLMERLDKNYSYRDQSAHSVSAD